MKKVVLLGAVAGMFILSSCGADQATVDKLTEEVCTVMEAYDAEDPMAILDAATGLLDVMEKEAEYSSVTEAQLLDAMEKKCPDGLKKFNELQNLE